MCSIEESIKTCTSDNQNQTERGSFFHWFLLMIHHRFVDATQIEHKYEDVDLIDKEGEQEKGTE